MTFLCLVPVVAVFALLARLRRRWFWVVYGIFSLVVFFILWLATSLSGGESLGSVLGASLFGFLAPEIWQGIRNALVNFLSQPKNAKYIVIIALLILSFFFPQIFGIFLVLFFTVIALKMILGDFLNR